MDCAPTMPELFQILHFDWVDIGGFELQKRDLHHHYQIKPMLPNVLHHTNEFEHDVAGQLYIANDSMPAPDIYDRVHFHALTDFFLEIYRNFPLEFYKKHSLKGIVLLSVERKLFLWQSVESDMLLENKLIIIVERKE